jgi:hypothetical protein
MAESGIKHNKIKKYQIKYFEVSSYIKVINKMKKKNIGTIPKSNRRTVESGKIPISHKYAIAHFLVCFRFLNKTWRG